MDERSCYTDRYIQKVLRFVLHLKSSFWYKNPPSDSSLTVVGEIRMHVSGHRSCWTLHLQVLLLGFSGLQEGGCWYQAICFCRETIQSSEKVTPVSSLLIVFSLSTLMIMKVLLQLKQFSNVAHKFNATLVYTIHA